MSDIRPEFRLVRSCLTCFYYTARTASKKIAPLRGAGKCSVNKTSNPKAAPLKTHAALVCDAHIWKGHGTFIPKITQRYNVDPPKELL